MIRTWIVSVLLSGILFGILVPAQSMAQFDQEFTDDVDNVCQQNPDADFCQDRDSGRELFGANGAATTVVEIISMLAGVLAVVMIVLAGFQFITAAGNPESIGKARDSILYALIGLGVAAMAQILVAFVLSRLE